MKNPTKSYCSHCERVTNQDTVHDTVDEHTPADTPEMEDAGVDYWGAHYQIVRCKGCDGYGFRRVVECSDNWDPETGEVELSVTPFPGPEPRREKRETPGDRWRRRWLPNAPTRVRRIYNETVDAYNANLLTLAAAGLRATVEAICMDKGVTGGTVIRTNADGTQSSNQRTNLEGKIAGLAEAHHLTAPHAEVLHQHRFMGNEAVHELQAPTQPDIEIALDVVEHTLDNLYELKHKMQQLIASRAARKP